MQEIIRVVTPHNFVIFCAILKAKTCYESFVDSLVQHLSIFLYIRLTNAKAFKLDLLLDILKEETFFSAEEMGIIKSSSGSSAKQKFIDVLEAKPVNNYSMFDDFMNCLTVDSTFSEYRDKVSKKESELHSAIGYIVQCKSPSKTKDHLSLTSGSKISSPQQSLFTNFKSVYGFGSILDVYFNHLKSTYSLLPAVSLQGWHDSKTHKKSYTNVTIVKSSQRIGQDYLYIMRSGKICEQETEYKAHRCKTDDEIFQYDDSEGKLLILIEGNAGTGKTTYSYNICKKWVSNEVLIEYRFLILVHLRDQNPGDVKNPQDLFASMGDKAGSVYTELQALHHNKKILFWLEGWDELHDDYKVRSVFTQLLRGQIFPKAAIVVSTRSSATASLTSFNFTQNFKLVGFNSEQIGSCARDYFSNCYSNKIEFELAQSKFIAQLRSIHGLSQLAEVPLNLSFLLELFVGDKNLPNNLTEIYEKMILVILQHHKNKNYNDKGALTSLTDDEQMHPDMQTILLGLGEHAYNNILAQKPFMYEELKMYITDRSLLNQQEFDGMGLLQTISKHTFTGDKTYYIYHYGIFQEFLSAVYLTTLEADEQKQALITIFGEASYEMVWIFHAGITKMTRIPIQSLLPVLSIPSLPDVQLPVKPFMDLANAWKKCHNHFLKMVINPSFNVGFLLTLMQCCYEAKNPLACKIITDHFYQNNLCRIEIPASRVTTYMLIALSYFIAHSGKMWSVRCVAAISSGVELLNTYITNPALYASNSERAGGLWVWCFVVKPSDINAFVKAIKVQPSLQWIHLLNGSCLGNEATVKLCECLKFDSQVMILELENCSIGKDGLQSVADMLIVNREILFIDLRKNLFTSEDIKEFLLTIKEKTILQYLLLDRQYIDNPDVIEIIREINLSRKRKETNLLIIDDHVSFDWNVEQVN